MSNGKLIVASARLPVTMARRQEGWEVRTSTGGLVTALKSVAERRRFTWIGWPGTHVAEAERPAVTAELAQHGSVPVFLSKAEIEGFYEGCSNRVLWPLFHGMLDRSHFSSSAWKVYYRVNEMFADEICRVAGPDDLIWVHDYQLALVPDLLRRRSVSSPVGFFLHIPFPSAEIYRTLPVREPLLRGLLGADLIGFHAYEYVSHFRSSCLRVLGVESDPDVIRVPARRVHLAVLPIGIDPAEIHEMAQSPEARQEYQTIQQTHRGKKIIVGVDRLDYTKGIPEKLLAFEELLRSQPRWRNKVVLIQVAAPSREAVDEYRLLKRDVDELVGRINGRFGTPTHTPIVYVNQSVPRNRLVGMYQAADVALITPLRDGMNLVALEYVAARGDRGGILILSEFAGAAHLLAGARLVSPYNLSEMTQVLSDALDRRGSSSAEHMLEFINQNTSMTWANRFLDRLEATASAVRPRSIRLDVNEGPAADRLRGARRPLVLLDYDGTLRDYEVKPSDAFPTARLREVLERLAAVATVYVISGRPADVLDQWLGDLDLGMVCEHGFAIKHPGEPWYPRRNIGGPGLKRIEPLFQDFVKRTPGSSIERKRSSIAWHYRAADPEWGTFQANELFTLLEDALKRRPYNVLRGARVIEVRHQNATKGHATSELLRRYANADALFCAGDDRTDEEMMEAIPVGWRSRTVTCWVGGRNAQAEFWVDSAGVLLEELTRLAQTWGAGRRQRPRMTAGGNRRAARHGARHRR